MIAPLLIDAVVMLPLSLLLQASLFSGKGAVFLGVVGAAFLSWLGYRSIAAASGMTSLGGAREDPSNSGRGELPPFVKGAMTHLSSPYPYFYWGTVGSSFVVQGFERGGPLAAAMFPLGFWLGVIVFNLIVIYLIGQGKRRLPPRFEPLFHRLSGALLILSGIYLLLRVSQGPF